MQGTCWSSLPAGELSAGQLVKLRQMEEGSGVLPGYQGPRDGMLSWVAVYSPLDLCYQDCAY